MSQIDNKKDEHVKKMNELTRYELAKVVGLRSLQLSEGEACKVQVKSEALAMDFLLMAALELKHRMLDVCVERNGTVYHISKLSLPSELDNLLLLRGEGLQEEELTSEAANL